MSLEEPGLPEPRRFCGSRTNSFEMRSRVSLSSSSSKDVLAFLTFNYAAKMFWKSACSVTPLKALRPVCILNIMQPRAQRSEAGSEILSYSISGDT